VTARRSLLVLPAAALLVLTAPARAEFFDDVKRTFQTDIPHFFQDDIPCAFGGQPTSGAKRSCHDGEPHAARPAPAPAHPASANRASAPPPRPRHSPDAKPDVVLTREQPDANGVVTREPPEYP
jgi:hypothetical protein